MTLRAFLDRVDRQVVRLGPRDYLAVEQLARSCDTWTSTALRAAIASVLARSADQWQRIVTIYDEMVAVVSPDEMPDEMPRTSQLRNDAARRVRWRREAKSSPKQRLVQRLAESRSWLGGRLRDAPPTLWAVVIGSAVVAVIAIAFAWLVPAETPDEAPPTSSTTDTSTETPLEEDGIVLRAVNLDRDRDPVVIRQPTELEAEVLLGLALLSTAVLALGFSWIRLPRTFRAQHVAALASQEERAEARRQRLQEAKAAAGRALGVRYHVDLFLPVSLQAVLDSAELLGRIFGESPGTDLDAEATLERTLAAAGRFEPVLAPRLHRHDVVVLIDIEEGSHPWLDSFLRLLDAWQAQGIALRRFTFHMAPELVVEAETRRSIRLGELARQTEDLPLIVFSRQLDPSARQGAASWVSVLEAWRRRAWLDPDPRARRELDRYRRRSIWELEHHGLFRFHLTDDDIVLLSQYLAGDGGARPVPRDSPLAPLPDDETAASEALRHWALVAALVPDPTWDQLEAIRRHFPEIHGPLPEPRCLQRLLEWVEQRTGTNAELEGGRGLAITPEHQDVWLRDRRRRDQADPAKPSFEDRARRLLLDQLGSTRPEDPVDYETWRFKRSMHQAMLEPHRALELLSWIGESSMRHEALWWLKAELARREDGDGEPLPLHDRDVLSSLMGKSDTIPLRALVAGRQWFGQISLPLAIFGATLVFGAENSLVGPAVSRHYAVEVKTVVLDRPPIYEVVERSFLPAMIDLPGGKYLMGDPVSDFDDERPVHRVEVAAFQISKTEVTVAQYRACVEAGVCAATDTGSSCNWEVEGRDEHPINCVSWLDAQRYAGWIGARLPTEAEWEYAARSGGLDRVYPWGEEPPSCDRAVVREGREQGCGTGGTWAVCSKTAGTTEQGLCDMAGNVWEWVEDDWHDNYDGASTDGSAWIGDPRASLRVIRGGSWRNFPRSARVANRGRVGPSIRLGFLGFRVARSLPPAL